jgi:RimJ/RimL family protein N-acetyltransferase
MLRRQPSLRTERLRLRPFVAEDAEAIHRLAGVRDLADTAISIPHPYSLAAAKSWIAGLPHLFRTGTAVHFALAVEGSTELIGSIALEAIDSQNAHAELTFWVGAAWRRAGYATEAAGEIVRFGFSQLSLNCIYAHHLVRDPESGHVLRKLGMKQEGVLRQRVRKWGIFEDLVLYAMLREDLGIGGGKE